MILTLTLVTIVGLLLLGTPLIIAMASGVAVYATLGGSWMLQYPQQVTDGMSSFVLLAMPLFILAGVVMNAGGVAERVFAFARAIFGSLPGGLAQVDVSTSLFFGGMVGTSVADLAGTGSTLIPQMKKHGYPGPYAAAVTASSSGIGPLIPPSSPMILYAAATGTSLGALFLAGIVPGIILTVVLMVVVAVQARRNGWGEKIPFSWREVWRTFRGAILAFGVPLLVVLGLTMGVFTPTESGAFAVVYAIVVSAVVFRSLGPRRLYRCLVEAAVLTGEVMLIVGVSVALGAVLAMAGLPKALTEFATQIVPGDAQLGYVLILTVVAILAGMLFDPLIPVIMPVMLPTMLAVGIDPVYFGVIIVLTVIIGQVSPPVAMSLVVAAKIARVDAWRVLRANTPFLVATVGVLLLVIFVPALATWLPTTLGE
ncbi:TRAP transporter large permease [Mycolicibacterium neoaurum]|uniref:TRAP transporter large permease n=1 Tax=Mycolicibacterium neoaurum TaxID=1795 RepID=UPI00248C06EA|nr:TRAP transporter large permease [Mycolicibacterium neoaurum]MDO3399384.1 TRAP transporter large permease [Mycolicibacterium neoaurum]WBP97049.1 TRAP transporter large permease [Mycolicibacterium neoaurum]WBS10670.1 TRAP transporter large permease [Mycolicibacterium neoaurum]